MAAASAEWNANGLVNDVQRPRMSCEASGWHSAKLNVQFSQTGARAMMVG
ncbi:hypothetical protein KOR34_30010 [Posidoniimonas corsicana]|uniref:Uncharacterized protein n=1 Tax=Posidoniimonas corsicana TaxID=1938618 RepID=A0A5C5VJ69_9BACT|nr:hypothetical protein [Posidoniimonas corsicana]TWT38033.1 hypothetical protein KOR34_30010 [Posidoniimonas corsicana]